MTEGFLLLAASAPYQQLARILDHISRTGDRSPRLDQIGFYFEKAIQKLPGPGVDFWGSKWTQLGLIAMATVAINYKVQMKATIKDMGQDIK